MELSWNKLAGALMTKPLALTAWGTITKCLGPACSHHLPIWKMAGASVHARGVALDVNRPVPAPRLEELAAETLRKKMLLHSWKDHLQIVEL